MTLTRKDAAATVLTVLVVAVFAACHEGWGVPLVGSSVRWAAGAIMLLGMVTCSLGGERTGKAAVVPSVLGITALALVLVALVWGSLTALSLLALDVVLLWLLSTLRHARGTAQPTPA